MSSLEGWSLVCQEQKIEGLWAGDNTAQEQVWVKQSVGQEKEDQPGGPSLSFFSTLNTQCLGNRNKVWAPSLFVGTKCRRVHLASHSCSSIG